MTPRSAAEGCRLMVTMLSDADAVLDSAEQALPALRRIAVWIQMSTIGIEGTERCAELAEQAGVTLRRRARARHARSG